MSRKLFLLISLIVMGKASFSQQIHHNLYVQINPENQSIDVIDSIRINEGDVKISGFNLSKCFEVDTNNKSFNISNGVCRSSMANYFLFKDTTMRNREFVVSYKGNPVSCFGLSPDSPHAISDSGMFLSSSTAWYPYFNEAPITFDLAVISSDDWRYISLGSPQLTSSPVGKKITRFECQFPMKDIYLIGGPFTEFDTIIDSVRIACYMRSADEQLVRKYIAATEKYLGMYGKLIGKYPYSSFSLVENYWESGFGMPSFTLLGKTIIRYPWIINSSYPHEILHNWWGNGVFVDYNQGNWCEGITTYMADHLFMEQKGAGAEYRRSTLQKYTDYVNETNDFPVLMFRSKQTSAQEAIGYGKVMMINEMLRYRLGDSIFVKAYSRFYESNKFKPASFLDISDAFEVVSGEKLDGFFYQWLHLKGAPELQIVNAELNNSGSTQELKFTLSQVQKEQEFGLDIPIAFYFEGDTLADLLNLQMKKRQQDYKFEFDRKLIGFEIDPQVNVFRRLAKEEVSPSLSSVFGGSEVLVIIPASDTMIEAYRNIAEAWKTSYSYQGRLVTIVSDSEIADLPENKTCWVLGHGNRFAKMLKFNSSQFDDKTMRTYKQVKDTGCLVYCISNPSDLNFSIGFLGINDPVTIPGLMRKLPHYGKYGYLGFLGKEPENVLKGNMPQENSPLRYLFLDKSDDMKLPRIKQRGALIQLGD